MGNWHCQNRYDVVVGQYPFQLDMTYCFFLHFLGLFVNLILGESKLEEYLLENEPVEANISKAKAQLGEGETYLQFVTQQDNKVPS